MYVRMKEILFVVNYNNNENLILYNLNNLPKMRKFGNAITVVYFKSSKIVSAIIGTYLFQINLFLWAKFS